jgi:hypothetical protein
MGSNLAVPPAHYGVPVRYRALVLPLAATGGDYLLWNWSLSTGHEIVALVAGLTLLPLVAVSCGLVGLTVLSLVARITRRSSTMTRSMRTSSKNRPRPAAHHAQQQPATRPSRDRLAA